MEQGPPTPKPDLAVESDISCHPKLGSLTKSVSALSPPRAKYLELQPRDCSRSWYRDCKHYKARSEIAKGTCSRSDLGHGAPSTAGERPNASGVQLFLAPLFLPLTPSLPETQSFQKTTLLALSPHIPIGYKDRQTSDFLGR